MRALRWHGRGDVRLDDVDEPLAPGPGEVSVEVLWCGICGTDLEEYLHGPLLVPTTPHPLTGCAAPLTLGHEVSARVLTGDADSGLAPGQLVALDGYYFCGQCPGCLRHEVNLCETWGHIGLSAPGGLTERMTVPSRMAIPATAAIAADALALAEPYSVAVRALRRGCWVGKGRRIAVLGAGTIGLAVLQVALTHGPAAVDVVDPDDVRRELAATLNATATASSAGELVDAGPSYDLVVDCTGSATAAADGLALLRRGGRLVAVGIPVEPARVDLRRIVLEELTLLGSVGHVYDEDFAAAVELICSGRVDAPALVTHRLSLAEAAERAFALLADRGDEKVVKVLVSPWT